MFKQDKVYIGVAFTFILVAVLYAVTFFILRIVYKEAMPEFEEKFTYIVLGINALLMRYFFVNRKQEKIGMGILLATFIGLFLALAYLYNHIWR